MSQNNYDPDSELKPNGQIPRQEVMYWSCLPKNSQVNQPTAFDFIPIQRTAIQKKKK